MPITKDQRRQKKCNHQYWIKDKLKVW